MAKNDVVSIGLLINKYPDLMNRTHPLWSKPLLQVGVDIDLFCAEDPLWVFLLGKCVRAAYHLLLVFLGLV